MTDILHSTGFTEAGAAWDHFPEAKRGAEVGPGGALLSPPEGETASLCGSGVHTRNGDSIEVRFRVLEGSGWLRFGFDAELHEHARVEVCLKTGTVSLSTTDWRLEQPVAAVRGAVAAERLHHLLIEKTEGAGALIRNADVTVYLDGARIMHIENLDLLPEMGVLVEVSGARVLVEEFVHRGRPSEIPEYLHLGGCQVLNVDNIEENLGSICRGLVMAAEAGVELLVTPEMSLTGLYPTSPRTREPEPVAAAEAQLRQFIRELPDAPHVIVGLPVWEAVTEHDLPETRYIASRVYDPDGEVLYTARKVHSAEQEMWHGYRLNEFDIQGVPISLYICHDNRYPELQTLPVMFGARLLLHPSNGGVVSGTISAFEASARAASRQTHAFHMHVNAGGGSYIVGPEREAELLAASEESRSDNPGSPTVGEPTECLFHANVRIHDAFGYWPTRALRASESIARAYADLYREIGGMREIPPC